MIHDRVTQIVIGVAALVSLIAWLTLIAVPAWRSYWRLRERVLALVMSVYVLAAFVLAGALGGRPGALVLRPALGGLSGTDADAPIRSSRSSGRPTSTLSTRSPRRSSPAPDCPRSCGRPRARSTPRWS